MSSLFTSLRDDLAPFADLGTEPPRCNEHGDSAVIRLARNGAKLTLNFTSDGRVVEQSESGERKHLSFRALLASNNFADLGRWADSQRVLLRRPVERETIPIIGEVAGTDLEGDVHFLNKFLIHSLADGARPRSLIMLVDGPAGIGKTSLIRSLAFERAENYRLTQQPLVLHVESRGRMLQNISDLMAFSLQTLRLTVTYDQVPILVRHGLVTLAVDGFDELGDPNGYELAWAQINDLVKSSQGGGTLLFAGRETFITKDRVRRALKSIDTSADKLEAFNLRGLSAPVARAWLSKQGWTEDNLRSAPVQSLFEEGSYALRPFFLSELAREGLQERVARGEVQELLPFLIESMIKREATKFGRDIEAITSATQREQFIRRLMEEVARDLAENQAASIQVETLSWLAEIAAYGLVPTELVGILKNRSGVIAFLSDDDRRGYKKFAHEYVYTYFLSLVTVSSIQSGELAKFVRRNIFSADFLDVFSNVCRSITQGEADTLIGKAAYLIKTIGDYDRARGNLTTLILAACSVVTPSEVPSITDVSVDEAYLTETVAHLALQDVVIGQLNVRGADFRSVHFRGECSVASLIADDGTVPSPSLPLPAILALPTKTVYDPGEIRQWLGRQVLAFGAVKPIPVDELLARFEPFALIARIARYKPYWLKDGEERGARRILDDPHWALVKGLLEKHELLTERSDIPAAGRPAAFYHLKNRTSLMNLEYPPESLLPFLRELLQESLALHREKAL